MSSSVIYIYIWIYCILDPLIGIGILHANLLNISSHYLFSPSCTPLNFNSTGSSHEQQTNVNGDPNQPDTETNMNMNMNIYNIMCQREEASPTLLLSTAQSPPPIRKGPGALIGCRVIPAG